MSVPIEVILSSDGSGQLWDVCAWDLTSGTSLVTYKGGTITTKTLCQLGAHQIIGAVHNKPLIQVWTLHKQDQGATRMVTPGKLTALAVTPDGQYCAGGANEKLYVWQVTTGNLFTVVSRHYQAITCVRFTDDGAYLITGGDDSLVLVWSLGDLLTSDPSSRPDPVYTWASHSLPITDIYIGSGGIEARVVTASQDHTCKLWDLVSGQMLLSCVFDCAIFTVCLDACETRLFAGGSHGDIFSVHLFQTPIKKERHVNRNNMGAGGDAGNDGQVCFRGHSKKVMCLTTSIDGTKLISGSLDCTVKIWDIFSAQCVKTLQHKGSVENVLVTMVTGDLLTPQSHPVIRVKQFKRHLVSESVGENERMTLDVHITGSNNIIRESNKTDVNLGRESEDNTVSELDTLKHDLQRCQAANRDLYDYTLQNILSNHGNKT